MVNSWVKAHRKTEESDIWTRKPAWWFKVWTYLIWRVNFEDKGQVKRGQQFFTHQMIYNGCYLSIDGIKVRAIDNVIRWLKSNDMLTTQKTTRGMFITICNYEAYQSDKKLKNDTGEHQDVKTKRHTNDTIIKELKNEKNKELNIPFKKFYDSGLIKKSPKKCEAKWGRLTDDERIAIMTTLPDYLISNDRQYLARTESYLNGRVWEDEIHIQKEVKNKSQQTNPNLNLDINPFTGEPNAKPESIQQGDGYIIENTGEENRLG